MKHGTRFWMIQQSLYQKTLGFSTYLQHQISSWLCHPQLPVQKGASTLDHSCFKGIYIIRISKYYTCYNGLVMICCHLKRCSPQTFNHLFIMGGNVSNRCRNVPRDVGALYVYETCLHPTPSKGASILKLEAFSEISQTAAISNPMLNFRYFFLPWLFIRCDCNNLTTSIWGVFGALCFVCWHLGGGVFLCFGGCLVIR